MWSNTAVCKWPVWMNCHCCTKMCMFEQRIIINTAMLSCSGRAAISQLWWLNTGGKGSSEGSPGTIFYSFGSAHWYSRCTRWICQTAPFPKNSCYLSDFLIRVDSWLHCTGFGRGNAAARYRSLRRPSPEMLSLMLLDLEICNTWRFFSLRFSVIR